MRWFNTGALCPRGMYGSASRNSIPGPGTVQNNMSLSKTLGLGDIRSMEIRATLNNVFNTVQYSGVDTNVTSPNVWPGGLNGTDALFNLRHGSGLRRVDAELDAKDGCGSGGAALAMPALAICATARCAAERAGWFRSRRLCAQGKRGASADERRSA